MKSAAKKIATPEPEVELFCDVEQRSEEWFALRRGVPTASKFATIMASGKDGGPSITRRKLLYTLAGEILTGQTAETFRNEAMDRGSAMEPDARAHYQKSRFDEMTSVGFARRKLPSGRYVGCSPDSLVGPKRVLEIKTMRPDLLIELAVHGGPGFPSEYRAQCQGNLWVTGRDEAELMLYYRGMPHAPTFLLERDPFYIREISEQVEVFDYDLNKIVEKMRAMGGSK